jgi:hypothetical protein
MSQFQLHLARLDNCNGEKRYDAWKKAISDDNAKNGRPNNCALLGNTNIGCGLNSLTFLGIFTVDQGKSLVASINANGTSFDQMINYVRMANGHKHVYQKVDFPISTKQEMTDFLDRLTTELPNNSCTVCKLHRHPDPKKRALPQCEKFTIGHSVVFSKDDNGVLYTIDPQQCSYRQRDDGKIFSSWSQNCYIQATLMFVASLQPPPPLKKVTNLQKISQYIANNVNYGEAPMDVVSPGPLVMNPGTPIPMDVETPPGSPLVNDVNYGEAPMDVVSPPGTRVKSKSRSTATKRSSRRTTAKRNPKRVTAVSKQITKTAKARSRKITQMRKRDS